MAYPSPIYSSANPAVDALFSREFAAQQATQAARERAAQEEIARSQIGSQYRLAQAQLEGTQADRDYNRLFREREFQAREKGDEARNQLYRDQLKIQQQQADTDKKYREGLISKPEDRIKAGVDAANAQAKATALRWQAVYETKLADSLEAARKMKAGRWFTTEKGAAEEMAQADDPERKTAEAKAWTDTMRELQLNKVDAPYIIPKFSSKTFDPAVFDEKGNLINQPFVAPAGTRNDFDWMGNPVDPGVAAGLGPPKPTPPAPVTTTPSAAAAAPSWMERTAIPYLRGIFGTGAEAAPMDLTGPEMTGGVSPAPVVTAPVAPAMIRIPIGGLGLMEVSAADAAEAERQLRSVPPDQVPAVAAAIRDNLIKSGRARIVTPSPGTAPVRPAGTLPATIPVLPDTNAAPAIVPSPGVTNPAALGPLAASPTTNYVTSVAGTEMVRRQIGNLVVLLNQQDNEDFERIMTRFQQLTQNPELLQKFELQTLKDFVGQGRAKVDLVGGIQ